MKNRILSAIAAICVLCVMFLQTASPALACSCVMRGMEWVQQEFRAAEVVFVGDVVAETEVIRLRPGGYTYAGTTYTFAVSKAWKGVNTAQVNVFHSRRVAPSPGEPTLISTCDAPEKPLGGRMFVYAVYSQTDAGEAVLMPLHGVDLCSSTRPIGYIEDAVREMDMLDIIKNSSMQVGMPRTGESMQATIVVLMTAGICLVSGVALRKHLSQ